VRIKEELEPNSAQKGMQGFSITQKGPPNIILSLAIQIGKKMIEAVKGGTSKQNKARERNVSQENAKKNPRLEGICTAKRKNEEVRLSSAPDKGTTGIL